MLKLAKNQAKAKQLLEAELLLFENSTHSSYENNRTYSSVCIHQITRLIIIKLKMKLENRSHRYDIINRPRSSRYGSQIW